LSDPTDGVRGERTPRTILHVITDLKTGGAENYLATLIERSDKRRFTHHVVSLIGEGELANRLRTAGATVLTLGMSRAIPDPRALWRLRRIIRQTSPDLIQSWLYHADLLTTVARFFTGAPPLIWTIRCADMLHGRRSGALYRVMRALAPLSNKPSAIVANSTAGRDFHTEFGYHPRRFEVIGNGVDTDLFRPSKEASIRLREELGASPETLLVGMIARFDPIKNHTLFLEAMGRLPKTIPFHIVLVGAGLDESNHEIVETAKSKGLYDRLSLLGRRDDMAAVTAGLDLLVSASQSEGYPNTLAEGMACAVPCVATDVGESRAIVGNADQIVPPGDREALAAAIERVLTLSSADRQVLGQRGRERMEREGSLRDAVARFEALYDHLIHERG